LNNVSAAETTLAGLVFALETTATKTETTAGVVFTNETTALRPAPLERRMEQLDPGLVFWMEVWKI